MNINTVFQNEKQAWRQVVSLSENEILQIEPEMRQNLFNQALTYLGNHFYKLNNSYKLGMDTSTILGKIIRFLPPKCVNNPSLPKILAFVQKKGVFYEQSLWNYFPFCAKTPNPILEKAVEADIISGNEDVVIKLIEHGFPVTSRMVELACGYGRHEVINAIIKSGALNNTMLSSLVSLAWDTLGPCEDLTVYANSILQYATDTICSTFLHMIYKTNPEKAFILACRYGLPEIARQLMAKGIKLNSSAFLPSILYTACLHCPQLVLEMIEKGAALHYSETTHLIKGIQNLSFEFEENARVELLRMCFNIDGYVERMEKFNVRKEAIEGVVKDYFVRNGIEAIYRNSLFSNPYSSEILNLNILDLKLRDFVSEVLWLKDRGYDQSHYQSCRIKIKNYRQELDDLGLGNKLDELDDIQAEDIRVKNLVFLVDAIILKKMFLGKDRATQHIKGVCAEAWIFSRSDLSSILLRDAFVSAGNADHLKVAASLPVFKFSWPHLFQERLENLLLIGVNPQIILDMLEKMNRTAVFKDGKNMQMFINLLFGLSCYAFLTVPEKEKILGRIFTDGCATVQTNKELGSAILSNISAVNGVLILGNNMRMLNNRDISLHEIVGTAFRKFFPLSDVKNIAQKYAEKIQSCRMPSAIITYASKIKSLDDQKSLECFAGYLTSVLNGDFHQKRYAPVNNPHLTALHAMDPNIIENWKKNLEPLTVDTEPGYITSSSLVVWVYQLFNKMDLQESKTALIQFNYLYRYFQAPNHEKPKIIKECSEAWEKSKKAKVISDEQKFQKNCLRLQQLLLQFPETKSPEKQLGLIRTIKNLLVQNPAIKSITPKDIDELGLPLKIQGKSIVVEESDDPIDLLLCGTEVAMSCQNVSGSAEMNKGLLGYLVDGKNKLLVIRDSEGRIAARCLIRILLKEDDNRERTIDDVDVDPVVYDDDKFVVYRETFYPKTISDEYKNALNQMVIAKAQALGIDAVSRDSVNDTLGKLQVKALKGCAPWEYCDGCGGNKEDGQYKIPYCTLLTKLLIKS